MGAVVIVGWCAFDLGVVVAVVVCGVAAIVALCVGTVVVVDGGWCAWSTPGLLLLCVGLPC